MEIRYFIPGQIALSRTNGGLLQAAIEGESHAEVVLYRTFPLTRPSQYISVRTPSGDELGVITDLAQLDPASRAAAEAELRLCYMTPRVMHIDRIRQEPGLWIWDLQTDRGPLRLVMRNLHEHLRAPGPDRMLITDMDGRRCEIDGIVGLDGHSKAELAKVL